mmetsp:Transcript_2404/g.6463  ORF Transcript_2404/g.6463 Transcript_2404/m.6463 type:complete len:444 (-) Transcript_2404:177-1508(-)
MRQADERGQGGFWASMSAVKQSMAEMQQELTRRHQARQAGMGGTNSFTANAALLASDMDTGEVPVVKLGDASVAAPFTSRLPSIKSTVDIVRQGRCTLVSKIQMQQVLALNCLISAYSLAALYLDGVRMGENQMIATGLLLTTASLAFSYARPVQELSPVRPITSIFHPAIWVSIAGQLAVHLASMMYAIALTRSVVSAEEAAVLDGVVEEVEPPPPAPDGQPIAMPFKPSLLNTVVFLMETAQQVSVMAVNYKGRPFMLAATENAAMGYSLLAVTAGVFVCAFEVVPQLNDLLKLVPMPSPEFRNSILTALTISVLGSHLWDRLCVAVFAPRLLWVGYVDAWRAAPPLKSQLAWWGKYGVLGGMVALAVLYDFSIIHLVAGWFLWRSIAARLDAWGGLVPAPTGATVAAPPATPTEEVAPTASQSAGPAPASTTNKVTQRRR